MRPVNLIPPDQRRGEQAPLRTGALVYLVVGALVAVLVGVTSLVLIDNKIAESKSEVVRLKREDAAATRKAQELASYTQFKILSEQRVQTVTSLAKSRFDWERVVRELALVLPQDVWLTELVATAAPGVNIDGGSGGNLRPAAAGPALQMIGCTTGQPAVAAFVTVLKDIDGVTRVGMESSKVAGEEGGAGTGGNSSDGGETDCRTRAFITKFEIVVAFDAAPAPISSAAGESEGATETAEATTDAGAEEG